MRWGLHRSDLSLVFFLWCMLVPCVPQISNTHAPSHPRDVKQNVIHQTRPPSSIAPWSGSDAHMPIVGIFVGGQVSMGTLTGLWLCSPICNKLQCIVYLDTFLSEPALTFFFFGNFSNNSLSVGSDYTASLDMSQ